MHRNKLIRIIIIKMFSLVFFPVNVFSGFLFSGSADAPVSGIRPPADPKGPPFDTFSEIHFWRTDPKIFLKAPIYTNFEEERAPKKRNFFVKIFQKVPKNGFFDCFVKVGARQCFGRARKINLVDLKKKRSSKFWKIFRKSAPPSRKS